MSSPWVVLSVLAVLLLSPVSEAQHTCVEYTGDVCRGLFSSNVSVPAGKTFEMQENAVYLYRSKLMAASFIYPECYQSVMAFLCTFKFSPCSQDTQVPQPTFPCNSMCTDIYHLCPSFVTEELGISCSTFPDTTMDFPVPMGCSVQNPKSIELSPCPDTDKLDRHPDTHVCTLKCDYDYYTPSQDSKLYTYGISVSFASLISSFIVFITWTIFPFKHTHPANMVMNISIGSIGLGIAQIMNLAPTNSIHCIDSITTADTTMPGCGIQGALIHFFSLSMACWWLCVAFNLHQMIVRRNTATADYQKYYHIFSWGFPGVLTIIALSLDAYHYSSTSFKVCFFKTYPQTDGLFLVWFLIIGFFGTSLLIHVSYKLYRAHVKMRGVSSVGHNVFRAQIRSYIFLAYYNWIVVSLIGFLYYVRTVFEAGEESLLNYFECLYLNVASDASACSYKPAVSFQLLSYTVIVVFGQGLLLFLTFMTTKDSIMCWKYLILEGRLDYDPRSAHKSMSSSEMRKSTAKEDGAIKASTAREPAFSGAQFATSEAKASLGED